MENKDKETLTKATKILSKYFQPGNDKIKRMRNQQSIWLLEDSLTALADTIETIENVRDGKIKPIFALEKENE